MSGPGARVCRHAGRTQRHCRVVVRRVKPCLLLAGSWQQRSQWTIRSRAAIERAQSPQSGAATHSERVVPGSIDIEAGEDPLPSCSAVEALDRQEPFINQTLAAGALAMLARLFRYGRLSHHGAFFNAKTGQMSAIPLDPELWSKTRRRSRNSAVQSSAGRTVVTDQAYVGRRRRFHA